MGCCYSCKEDSSQNDESNERTHLLVDPVSNSNNVHQLMNENFMIRHPNAFEKKTDEQSALTRILQETANNVIDVTALNLNGLQEHEYLDKMKQYSERMQHICTQNKLTFNKTQFLLQDVSMPEKILTSEPINADDRNLMAVAITKASTAVSDLKIEHKEDLVVPFQIP